MSCVLVPFHQEGGRTIELLRMSLSFAEFHPSFILPELQDPEHPLTVSGSWNPRKGSTTPPLPGGWLDGAWTALLDVWLKACDHKLRASLTALMSWKSGGGAAKIYSFYLGNLPPVKGGINWAKRDSAQWLLIASNEDQENLW